MHFVAHVLLIVGLCLAADNKSSTETEEVQTRKAKQEELVEVYKTRIRHAKVIANQIDDLLWRVNEEKEREEIELLAKSRTIFTDFEKVTKKYYNQLRSVSEKLEDTSEVSYENVALVGTQNRCVCLSGEKGARSAVYSTKLRRRFDRKS